MLTTLITLLEAREEADLRLSREISSTKEAEEEALEETEVAEDREDSLEEEVGDQKDDGTPVWPG